MHLRRKVTAWATALAVGAVLASLPAAPAHAALPTGTLVEPAPSTSFEAGSTMDLRVDAEDTTGPTPGVRVVEWWLYADETKGAPTDFSTQYPHNGEDKFLIARATAPTTGTRESGSWTATWTVPSTGYYDATVDGDHTTPIPEGETRRYELPSGQYEVQGHMLDDEWLANPGAPGFTNKEVVFLSTGSTATPSPSPSATPSPTPSEPAGGLVQNADLEAGSGDTFDCFRMHGWGTHAATLTAAAGRGGSGRAAELRMADYQSGDRKFTQTENDACAPAVTPGQQYDLGVWYTSTQPANLTLFRHSAAGWTYWTDLRQAEPASAFTHYQVRTPAVPDGTDRIVWGLGIAGDGSLVVDDFSMAAVVEDPPPPPPATGELIVNGDLALGTGVPQCFQFVGWGEHASQGSFTTDLPTGRSGRSWTISTTAYASGDHKLLPAGDTGCAPYVEPTKTYTMRVFYRGTSTRNALTLFRHTASGWEYWMDLQSLPATSSWTEVVVQTPEVPAGTDRLTFGISTSSDGTLSTHGYSLTEFVPPPPPTPTDPAVTGQWTTFMPPGDVRAMHATVLRDGRVMLLAGSGNSADQFVAGTFRTLLWQPRDNTFKEVATPEDMFCAGHVTLPDGKVLVAGGTQNYPGTGGAANFQGAKFTHVFDPATDSYTRIGDMAEEHWYPTLTKLENGDVWAAGGLNGASHGSVSTEMFSFAQQAWLSLTSVPQTWSFWGTYPHMYLMADGRLFYSGGHTFGAQLPGTGASIYDWRTASIGDVPGLRDPHLRDQAGSVLLPPAQNQTVMIAGGGHTELNVDGTDRVDLIDLNASSPAYVPGPDLPGGARAYVNLVTLPDRTVLATGGATGNRGPHVLSSAIYDPRTNTWVEVPSDQVGRGYHSSALLLPDGRVAVFGGNPLDNSWNFAISVYEPGYLFKGERPTVTGPRQATHGQTVELQVTGTVVAASLTAPMSATHQTDTNARLIDLPIAGSGSTRSATIPANRALVPPGPYMLTVMDDAGIPSVASWIEVR